MTYIVCRALLLIAYILYRQHLKKQERRAHTIRLRVLLVEMEEAESAFKSYSSPSAGYFTNYMLTTWQNRWDNVFTQAAYSRYPASELASGEKALFQSFLDHNQHGQALRQAYNTAFIPAELERYDHLFSHVEGRSLDMQQRTAIVSDEDNCLVIGTGQPRLPCLPHQWSRKICRHA